MFEGKFLRRWAVSAACTFAMAGTVSSWADEPPVSETQSTILGVFSGLGGDLSGAAAFGESGAAGYGTVAAPGGATAYGGRMRYLGEPAGLEAAYDGGSLPAQIVAQRTQLLASLRQLQDAYCRAGMLDEAIAVRDQVRAIEGLEQTPLPPISSIVSIVGIDYGYPSLPAVQNDGTPYELCGRVGETFYTQVTGAANGSIWGDGVYTCDSDLATAAVHAGALAEGETAVVAFTMLEGQPSYGSSSKNGVTTSSWGSYRGSFRVEAAAPALHSLYHLRGQGKERMAVFVVGAAGAGSVWGSDVYTDDSALGAAAVHAGWLQEGAKGILNVEFLAGKESYAGSSRNGVTSRDYNAWEASFRFLEPQVTTGPASMEEPKFEGAIPTNVSPYELRGRNGQTFSATVTGQSGGSVWGDGIYTDDSSLATAAVHAGVLDEGETGTVRFTILPGETSYGSSSKNGVTTSSWGAYGGSFRVEGDASSAEEALRTETRTVTGSTTGTVWGSGVYTSDSDVGTAAVHAGMLADGQTGTVTIEFLAGRDSYAGSESNGITTYSYGAWSGSYRFVGASPSGPSGPALSTESREVTGSTTGTVWGSGVYTSDSDLGTAAVHAGILADGQTGIVTIDHLEGQESYTGSESNGIKTRDYGPWSGSFRFSDEGRTVQPKPEAGSSDVDSSGKIRLER